MSNRTYTNVAATEQLTVTVGPDSTSFESLLAAPPGVWQQVADTIRESKQGLWRSMSAAWLEREWERRSRARLNISAGGIQDWLTWNLYGVARSSSTGERSEPRRPRGPYLCRLHSDCLERPVAAHACWAYTVESRNDPARRYARHVDRLERRRRGR